MSKGKNVVAAAIVAAAAGYVAGILTAPKSGKETRQDIKDAAEKYRAEASVKLQELRVELNQVISEASNKTRVLTDKGKKEVTLLVDKAKVAQDKAKDVLSAVKKGEAEDADLQKAITEAKDAKNHLVDYLKRS